VANKLMGVCYNKSGQVAMSVDRLKMEKNIINKFNKVGRLKYESYLIRTLEAIQEEIRKPKAANNFTFFPLNPYFLDVIISNVYPSIWILYILCSKILQY